MSIQYYLRANHLTPEPDDYMANVVSARTVELDDVIKRMIDRGSTVTRADIVSVFEDFESSIESLISEGASVNLPFANFSTSIKGIFNGPADTFDKTRHYISLIVNPGRKIKNYLQSGLSVEKLESVVPAPALLEFTDFATGEKDSTITPGGMAQIIGHRLKYNTEDALEGIFFVAADNTETKVTIVGTIKPSQLMFSIPAGLTSGEYKLEVRAKTGENLRKGALLSSLTVA